MRTLSKIKLRLLLVTVLLFSLTSIGVVSVAQPERGEVEGPYGSTAYSPSLLGIAAGCGDIFIRTPEKYQYGVVPTIDGIISVGSITSIPTPPLLVPQVGYMFEEGFPEEAEGRVNSIAGSGTDDALYATALGSLYKNKPIIWYDVDTPKETLEEINFTIEGTEIIAVPWLFTYNMPYQRNFAFSGWGISQTCDKWDGAVFVEFLKLRNEKLEPVTQPAPIAPLDKEGELYPLNF